MRAIVLSLAAGSALADPVRPPAPVPARVSDSAVPGDSVDPLDKIVCKTLAPKTGTLLGQRRVCRTQRDWDTAHQNAAKDLTKMQTEKGMHQ
jgi:hypothetical protein